MYFGESGSSEFEESNKNAGVNGKSSDSGDRVS